MIRMTLAAAFLTTAHSAALAAADDLTTLSTGAEITTGKYGGTQSTDIFYVPFTVKHETGPWALKLTVPYIEITGPGNVIGAGEDRVTVGGGNGPRRTESGLGDIVGSVFYNVVNERTAPFGLDLGAKLKLGTADRDKGLGTGKNDFSVQADAFKPIGAFTPFATLGYRWYGDPPGTNLRDVFYGSVGSSYRISRPTTVGLAYDFREPIVAGGARVSELTAYLSQRFSGGWKLQVYSVVGFSDASPDFGAGATLSYAF
jgi:hypothetical protein